jgi:hypothetical protein
MNDRRWAASTAAVGVALVAALTSAFAFQKDDKDKDQDKSKPKLTLKAQPVISMSPSRVVLTAELVGGAADLQDYYCPSLAWDWGDGTTSEASNDCQPYEPGKSEIKRRFTVEHMFHAGSYRIMLRLKQRDRTVALATTTIQVRPGLRDIGH